MRERMPFRLPVEFVRLGEAVVLKRWGVEGNNKHWLREGVHPTHLHPNEQKRSPGTPVRDETAMNGARERLMVD